MKKLLTRLISLSLMALLICSYIPMQFLADSPVWDGKRSSDFGGGSGTADDPWQISNAKEYAFMRYLFTNTILKEDIGKGGHEVFGSDYFVLTNDIYLNDTSNFDNWSYKAPPTNEWPGWHGGYALGGSFDGQGHTIYGGYAMENTVLPGAYGANAILKNINVKQTLVYAGATQGVSEGVGAGGRMENCVVDAKVYGISGRAIGGICGELGNGIIKNCAFYGLVESSTESVGGIVGSIGVGGTKDDSNGIISCCINYGTIRGTSIVGGITGVVGNIWLASNVDNCINLGEVNATKENGIVGGICGSLGYAYDQTYGTSCRSGGGISLNSCINVGNVTATNSTSVGAIVGNAVAATSISNCAYDSGTTSAPSIGNDEAGMAGNIKAISDEELKQPSSISSLGLDGNIWTASSGYYPLVAALQNGGQLRQIDVPVINGAKTDNSSAGSGAGSTGNSGAQSSSNHSKSVPTTTTKVIDGKVVEVDDQGNIVSSSEDNSSNNNSKNTGKTSSKNSSTKKNVLDNSNKKASFPWLAIIIPGAIILVVGGFSIYYFLIKKQTFNDLTGMIKAKIRKK